MKNIFFLIAFLPFTAFANVDSANTLYQSGQFQEALIEYQSAANQGDAMAAYLAAKMLHTHASIEHNYADAITLYKQAAEGGIREAGLPLGKIYSSPMVPTPDMPYVQEMLEFAATDPLGGEHVMEAAYFLAQIHIGFKSDNTTIYKWLELAADNGHVDAAADVGYQYYSGAKMAKKPMKAFRYTQIAARGGHAVSQYNLGLMHNQGVGIRKNNETALTWFMIAAKTDPKTDNGTIANFKLGLPAAQFKKAEVQAERLFSRYNRNSQ
ncbi:MAG: tetratricopeptide repeat protein [Emcibacteraceae bacterium]|nr:tetratricopeptide repeat protein [Emcibacteraceae bacterium]